ncbi:GTP-binding protein [Moritella sp. Urea-trap-13]|uniref:CobW family GTP-binding protein n=1 Tax=Moritella sp. Urea-trap-13 TaxID=2058327 RepID=UPI000C347B5B|nr:GTP-binding protein [Moritella sp. Urea-trap-13]PKH09068.1 GTP-binding protein [Moritella sp. Urea-trap-13]
MSKQANKIPTNIITGFLGVGKTTAIQQLLKQKPADETWGILVNEFGQIGIDGTLLSAFTDTLTDQAQRIIVKEVPGGCLCCVAGLPMKMGLNMLISKAKPDRILIEPTGLGHLQQVIKDLSGEFYCDVLALNATICLVDPSHLNDAKYVENNHFQDQISLADVLVANKTEHLNKADKVRFMDFSHQLSPAKQSVLWTHHGDFSIDMLTLSLDEQRRSQHLSAHLKHSHGHHHQQALVELVIDPRFERNHGSGQGLFSYGWIFNQHQTFNLMALATQLEPLEVVRLKAAIKTEQGCFAINSINGECDFMPISELETSKIEIISMIELPWQQLEEALCDSLLPK